MTVIEFTPGLVPVLKHAQHDQSDHGRRGSSGSGISVENVTSHQESGVTVYTGTTAPGTVAYRGVRGSELWGPAGAATNGVWRSLGGYNTSVEGGPGGSTMFASKPDELTDKVHRYTHIVKADIGGLPFRTLREPQGGQVNADIGLGLGITGEIPLSRIISVTAARDGRDSTDFFWRQVEEGGFPVTKHGTHDQSDHGRRGSGSPAGRALDPTNADDVREAFTGTIETRAGTVSVVVDSVDVFDFSTTVQGALIGPGGEYVGRWSRTVTPEIKVMYNESFEVAEGSRKSGIGTEFQKHSEQAALALGMEKIVIRAAMDGKEAWASERFGFDFAGPPSEGLYRAEQLAGPKGLNRPEALKQVKEWQSRFDGPESGWPKPHEILAAQGDPVFRLFTDRPEQVLGSFVLGYGWEGKKPADRVTKRVEPKMFYVTVESDYADVAKHGSHNQSDHGRRGGGSSAGPEEYVTHEEYKKRVEAHAEESGWIDTSRSVKDATNMLKMSVVERIAERMDVSTEELVSACFLENADGGLNENESTRAVWQQALTPGEGQRVYLEPRGLYVFDSRSDNADAAAGRPPSVPAGSPEAEALVRRVAVDSLVRAWAWSSNDSSIKSLAVQRAAEDVFQIKDATPWKDGGINESVDTHYQKHKDTFQQFVRAQYDETQSMFKAIGVTEMDVYRGESGERFRRSVDLPSGSSTETTTTMRPLSSWASDYQMAQNFSSGMGETGVVLKVRVPVSRILATPYTGNGCKNENEIVLMGGASTVQVAGVGPGGEEIFKAALRPMKAALLQIDEDDDSADWIKTLSWDLPTTADGMAAVFGVDWRAKISKLPAWKAVPESLKSAPVTVKFAPGLKPVTKHGIHDQSSHGNWAHGKGTGSHAGEAKMGPPSATDGYGNARTTTYISGNRGETQTPLPDGWFRATEQEHDDYDRAAMRAMMRPEMLEGIDKGSPLEDDYLRAYRSVAASKVQLFAGPNGTGVVVQGEISWRDDFTPEDFVQNLKQLSELQRVTPAPGLQVIVGTQEFSKHSFDESTRGFVDTRDVDTMHLRPSALSAGNKYDVEGSRRWDNLMSTSEANRPVYALTHEYGHVVDRRSNESALADFNEVVQSNRGLITGSSPYAREGYFGEGAGGRGLQVGDKPTGREMYAEAWTGWVLSKGWAARNPGMVQFFAEKYGWDSETGTAPMAKAKSKGRIYMDSFGPEGGWVLDSLPGESATVVFAPGLKPVLKHAQHNQSDHGRRGGGSGTGSQDGGVTPVVNDFTDSDGNLAKPMSMRDSDHPDEVITVIPARANPMDGLNVVSIYKGEEQAGVMRYEPYSGKVEWINVEEKFRRQGVATRLWEAGKYVAARHPNMIEPKHSQSQTTEGAAWASVVKFYRSIEVNDGVAKHGSHAQLSHGNRSKGIDRTEMPQIPKANREAFLAELTDSGISHREEAVDPRDLRRTQRAIDPVNVAQMHAAMVAGTMKEGLPIIVSSDGKVLDGHHRWAAAAQLAGEVPGTTVKITRVDMKMDDLLARARKFNEEQGIAARAIGEVRPVAKHEQHDQSSHGRKAGSQSTPVPVTPESVAKAFDGTYTTDSGLEFTLASQSSTGAGGGSVTVEGEIIVGDAVIGHWVRKVSGTTMYAESLNVGKDFDGNSLPGAEQFQGKGIALEVQKQTEKAARELGCTEIRVSAMSDGVAAWAQERFGYRFEEKPSLRATSKAGREPRDDAERAVPLGGVGYPNGSREYRGEDGLMYGFSHPDLGVPAVRNALAKVEQRFKSDDRDDWPSPSEVVSLGTGRRVDDDIIEGRTLGEFLLSRGWSGVKSADHVTKAVGEVVRVVVEGVERPVAKHGSHDQRSHGRRYSSAVSGGLTASIADRVREYGGLSVNIFDGSEPETGFMVARGHGKGAIVTAEEFYDPEKGPEILTDFLIKYRSDLTGGAYLGLWHNKKDGNVYLDVSDQIAEQAQAEKLGGPKFRDQISIWDVVAGEEIQTGGSGKLKKGVRDGGTGVTGRSVAESLHGYGRGDQGLRERVVGQVRGSVSIGFTPGLVPVLKHGTTHNEADHGRRRGSSSAEIARSEASGEVDYMMHEGRWLDEQLSRDGMAMPPPPGVLDYIAKAADKVEEWVDRRLNPPLESLPKAEITQIVMANRARVDASRAARGLPPTQWPEWDGGSVEKADADVVDILRRLFAGEVDDRLFQLMKRDERPLVERDGPFADLLDVMLNAVGRVAGDEAVTKHEQHNQKDHGRRSGNGGEDPKAMSPELQAAFDHATGIFTTPGPEAVALANLEAVAINHAVSLGMSADDVPYRDLTEVGLYGKAVIRRAYDKRDQDERFAERSDADNEALATVMDDWRFGGDVMVKVPSDVLDDIIADRVKNQFDTDTSRGLYDPDVRAVAETAAHGLHPAAPASERPIYGFVGMPGSEHPYALDQYGDVTLVLKPSVKDKTTITLGDSLNQNATPIPMNGTASIRELSDAAGRNPFVDHGAIVAIGGRDQLEYGETFMEAQIFGGIRLEQISRIVFREGDANPDGVAMLREELEGSGVSVEII